MRGITIITVWLALVGMLGDCLGVLSSALLLYELILGQKTCDSTWLTQPQVNVADGLSATTFIVCRLTPVGLGVVASHAIIVYVKVAVLLGMFAVGWSKEGESVRATVSHVTARLASLPWGEVWNANKDDREGACICGLCLAVFTPIIFPFGFFCVISELLFCLCYAPRLRTWGVTLIRLAASRPLYDTIFLLFESTPGLIITIMLFLSRYTATSWSAILFAVPSIASTFARLLRFFLADVIAPGSVACFHNLVSTCRFCCSEVAEDEENGIQMQKSAKVAPGPVTEIVPTFREKE